MELRRGALCVRPRFWHRYEVTVVARGVDESVVTDHLEAQSSQTGAGKIRAMQVCDGGPAPQPPRPPLEPASARGALLFRRSQESGSFAMLAAMRRASSRVRRWRQSPTWPCVPLPPFSLRGSNEKLISGRQQSPHGE
jgi:hypothetical protein